MIFESVSKITKMNKDEFLELILIYIRLVEVIAEKNNLVIPEVENISKDIVLELNEMGVIDKNEDLKLLQKILGENFSRFMNSVSFYLKNDSVYGHILDKLNNKKRKKLQQITSSQDKPTFADFFAGAGGLSCGFTQAGYKVSFANDFEDVCIRTYRYNHPELASNKIIKGDIRQLVDNLDDYMSEKIDVVVGGPPCQGFSSANQQRIIDDPRNELYKYYLKAIAKLLPKFVVMENVRGMLKVADQVVEDYSNIKEIRNGFTYTYSVAYKLLNSADFSVAQNRERLIYIAVRNDVMRDKGIKPMDIFNEMERVNKDNPHFLLKDALDAIKPLDAPRVKNTNEVDDELTGKKIDVNEFMGNENAYLALINESRYIPLLFNHKARYVNDI